MRELIITAARRLETKSPLYLAYELPDFVRDYYWHMVKQHEERGIYFEKLRISQPFKPRTTGDKSQNHHINGHIQQLCVQTGMDFDILKYYLKTPKPENFLLKNFGKNMTGLFLVKRDLHFIIKVNWRFRERDKILCNPEKGN